MNATRFALRGRFVWMVALALCAGLFRTTVAYAAQEKKEEKKEEKKDEKKPLSLKSDRKVEFTTDEGTWLSLDVSPDGKTIAFELLGDIYTLPVDGGKATLIAGGMAFDSQPKFSPDGKWIAFLSDREGSENIWIMHPDGTEPKQISKEEKAEFASPNWTPDGQYILVSKAGFGINTFEIWMYHVQGGSGVQVTKAKPTPTVRRREQLNNLGVSASADGIYFYYAHRVGGFTYEAQFPLWQVGRRDRKTGDEDILINQLGSSVRPVLSPDGASLLYVTRHETESGLRMRNLQTGEDRWVKYPITRDDQESRFTRDLYPGYAFLPGGKEIVYNNDGKIYRLDITTGAEKLIPFTAKVSQDLGPKLDFPQKVDEGPVKARLIQDPVESPDGKRLAFSALTHLYVMDIPGGKPQRLTTGNAKEFQPTWSPDGKWIAYVTWSAGGGGIWRVPSTGGTPKQLTQTSAFYSDPAWSPHEDRVVALRGNAYDRDNSTFDFGIAGSPDLIWIPADGGPASLIIPARGAGKPHFTNEKDRIYLYTQGGLISLRYDGTDRRTHLQVKSPPLGFSDEPGPADDVRVSPDGSWVLAHIMNQLYVAAIPTVGGEAPTVMINAGSVPVKKITDIGADYFAWADGGKTMTWAIGASFFRQPLSAISFEPPKEEKKEADKKKDTPKTEAKTDGDKKDAAAADAQKKDDAKKDEQAKKEPEKLKEQDKSVEEFRVNLEFPRKTPKGTIVLRGATVLTMKGDLGHEEVLKNADIVVENNRI